MRSIVVLHDEGSTMNICYRIDIDKAWRAALRIMRVQALLAADAGVSDEEIISAVSVGSSTVYLIKRRLVSNSLYSGQRGGIVDRDCLLHPAAAAQALDVGVVGRRRGAPRRTRCLVE